MKPCVLRIGLAALLTVGIGLAWWARHTLTTEAIVAWVEALGVWGPLVFVGLYGLAPALFVPGSVLTLAGGGPLWPDYRCAVEPGWGRHGGNRGVSPRPLRGGRLGRAPAGETLASDQGRG